MPVIKTAVGVVYKDAFIRLEREFDTRRIIDASQGLNEIRLEMDEIDRWQKELSKLHKMAAYLFNDDDEFSPPSGPIYETAFELADEILTWKEKIDEVYDLLLDLQDLTPEDDTDEDED